ncbi:MAG: hypothetical protein ACJ0BE_04235 [Dehalococcoidia bacterium]
MLFKKLNLVYSSLLIIILVFSISCSDNTKLNLSSQNMSANEILENTRNEMSLINSYQLDLKHSSGTGTPIGNTGLTLSEASARINSPDEIYIEGNLLFGNIVLKTKYIKRASESYYINPITQNWESIENNANPLSVAVNGLNEILFSTINQIESPTVDNSDTSNYIIQGTISPSIFKLLLEETLENSLETKLTIDKNDYRVLKIEISGQASKYDAPKIIRKLTISKFDELFNISSLQLE